jgi:hypothetical protein
MVKLGEMFFWGWDGDMRAKDVVERRCESNAR